MWRAIAVFFFFVPSLANAQLMSPAKEAQLISMQPVVEDLDLSGRVLVYYTDAEMPPAHQHQAGRGTFFLSSRYNISGAVGEPVGHGWEFPWKHPGGLHKVDKFKSWKVMALPIGTRVQVFRTTLDGMLPQVPVRGWDWSFPEDTIFVEYLAFDDYTVFEVRAAHKKDGRWRSKRFFPFESSNNFKDAGGQVVITGKMVLEDNLHGRPGRQGIAAFEREISVDWISGPRSLMAGRKFARSDWAPAAKQDSIVPAKYLGAFAVSNCSSCHEHAGMHVDVFDKQRDWYGFVRGSLSEKRLSFHPADRSAISSNGISRQFMLRRELVEAGLLEMR